MGSISPSSITAVGGLAGLSSFRQGDDVNASSIGQPFSRVEQASGGSLGLYDLTVE